MRASTAACLLPILLLALPAASRSQQDGLPDGTDFAIVRAGQGLTLHKEMYAEPFTYSDDYHGRQTEVVFQLGAKHDIAGTRFYLAYSQISFWQAYDSANSSPFRDTNYNPEIFYRFPETARGAVTLGADAGGEHESNGQQVPLSRSWNLLYVTPFVRGDNWLVRVKLRYRLPEDPKDTPLSAVGDDNPDITDFLGHSDIDVYYGLPGEHRLHLQIRGYVGTDKGNLGLTYSLPVPRTRDSFLMLRVFNGHGESLRDYNRFMSRIGVGMMFNR